GALDHRPGCGAEPDAQFARDDLRQGGLAEAGRPVQQDVVQRLIACAGGGDEDGEVFARRLLPGEVGQDLRAEGCLGGVFLPPFRGDGAIGLAHAWLTAFMRPPGPRAAYLGANFVGATRARGPIRTTHYRPDVTPDPSHDCTPRNKEGQCRSALPLRGEMTGEITGS